MSDAAALRIDALCEADYAQVLALNEKAVPAVNGIPERVLGELHRDAVCAPVIREGVQVRGFALLLDQTARYESPNFLWFTANYPAFVYVDRIVVDSRHAGRGIGRALYRSAGAAAARRSVILGCEVNLEPPNPGSIAFHERLGFKSVGQQLIDGGAKCVSFMVHTQPHELF